MTTLTERLIRIKDSLTNRADRDAISEAVNEIEALRSERDALSGAVRRLAEMPALNRRGVTNPIAAEYGGFTETIPQTARQTGGGGEDMIDGYTGPTISEAIAKNEAPVDAHFTREEWFSLPLTLRQRWWAETDFSSKPPSQALMAEVAAKIRSGE